MMKRKNRIMRLRIKSAMTVLLITGVLVTGNDSPSFAAPATKAAATPQVLIGAGDAPRAGAMLDLNSTTQGLLLPTIELTADTTEFVLVDTDKASAYGMMIYNTNDEVADGKGVYVWSGSAWYLMTAFPVSVLLDPDAVTYGTIGLQEPLMLVLKPDQVQHKSVVWDSSNKAVATVDQTGVVTTLSNGSTTITATTADGQVATCVVGVDNGCSDGIFAADLCWSTESKTVTNAQIACEEGWRVPTVDELITAVGLQQLGLINANYWSGDVRLVNTEDGGCESWNRYAVGGGDAAIYDVPVIIATPGTAGVYGWGAPDYVLVCKNETPGNWLGVCDATRIGASGYKKVAYGQCNAPTNIIRVNYVCTVLQSPSSCGNTASNTTSILKCVKSI